MALSAEEKASKRATALAKLYETKQRIEQAKKGTAPSSSSDITTGAANGPAPKRSAPEITEPRAPGQSLNQQPAKRHRDASVKKSSLLAKPYIEYDMSTLVDSKGGYMIPEEEESGQKWIEALPQSKPPYSFDDPRAPTCFECGTKELDFRMYYAFRTRVCTACRKADPDKYSLLTKTECRQDYLLTEPELRDEQLFPRLERPNPYKSTYSNMMLYMRYQVEEFAFKKWGGPEGLDGEYERRETAKAQRKRAKFEARLRDMRNKARAQAITGAGHERHQHAWGEPRPQANGTIVRECPCGMTIEEVSV